MKRQKTHPTHQDPVCGMEVSYTTAADEFIFRGKRNMTEDHNYLREETN